MNLFIRLFVRWLLSRNQRLVPGAVSEQHYRILPHDMGWRNHLPNFRFLSFMELGRFSYWRGIRDELKQSTGMRLIAAQEMIYIRPVGFMARLKMETSLIGWDQKYVYFRHDFYVGNKLVATGVVKEACVVKGSVIAPVEVFCGESPQEAASLMESWQKFQSEIRSASGSR